MLKSYFVMRFSHALLVGATHSRVCVEGVDDCIRRDSNRLSVC